MNRRKSCFLAVVSIFLTAFALLMVAGSGAAGLDGVVRYLHINTPAQIVSGNYAEVLVRLTDQRGNVLSGIPYGDPSVPGSFYIESISDGSGNTVSFSVYGDDVTEQNGVFTVPVLINGGEVAGGSSVRIRAGYSGKDGEPEYVTSESYQVYASSLTTYDGSPSGSLAGYIALQADKVVVTEGSVLACDIKLTDHAGRAIGNLSSVDFTFLRAVNQDGTEHLFNIESVENLLHGRYRIRLGIAGVTEGDLLSVGLGVSVQGHVLDAFTTVLVSASDAIGPPNPHYANPYLADQDATGPATSGLTLSRTITNGKHDITLTGVFDESQTGNTELFSGEYFINTPGADGTGHAITVAPGSNWTQFSVIIPESLLDPLPDGEHTIRVQARDIAGNWGDYGTITFTMDKNLVTSKIITPESGAFIRGGNYHVTGRVHNAGGTIIQSVEVSVDYGPWQAATNTGINFSEWRYSLNTTNLFDGLHTIRSRAKTESGYTEVSVLSVFFFVDNTPPQAVMTSPIDGMSIGGVHEVRGIASDQHIDNWTLDYGAGASPDSWEPLASGTESRYGFTAVHQFTPDFQGGTFTNTEVIDPGIIRPVAFLNLARDKFIYAHNSANTKTELLLTNGVNEASGTGWVDTTTSTTINLWAIIDLEAVQTLTAFTIRAVGTATLRDYSISVSNTGAFAGEQITVVTVTDNILQTVTDTLATPVQARFVRFHFTRKSATSALAFQELEVMGAAATTTAEYISKVIDAGQAVAWNGFRQDFNAPAGAKVATRLRAGNTPVPDETWTEWSRAYTDSFENSEVGSSRYLQYQVEFTGAAAVFPEFYGIEFYAGEHLTTWDLSGFPEGTYSLRLRVRDVAGNQLEQQVTFHIDNSTGSVSITDPLPDQVIPGVYEVRGQYSSLAGARRIELVVNGSETYQAEILDGQNWRLLLNTASLPNDSMVTLKAVMLNKNGLTAESAETVAVVHNLKPVVALNLDENSYHRQTVTVTGTVLPQERPIASYRLEVGRGYQPPTWTLLGQGTTGVDNGLLGNLNTTLFLTNVTHIVRLTVEDDLGNVHEVGRRVLFDNTIPNIQIMTASFTTDDRWTGQIRVWDLQAFDHWQIRTGFRGNTYNAGAATTDVLLGTGTETTSPTDSGNRHTFGPYSFDIAPGWWTISGHAFDQAGNTHIHSQAFTLYWDPDPPTAIIHTPAANQYYKVGDVMAITITAADDNFVQSSNLSRSPPPYTSWTSIWSGTSNTKYFNQLVNFTITAALAEGPHQLRLRVVDRGNRTTDHIVPFFVDKTAPTGFITSHNNGDLVPGVFTISGRAYDNLSGVDQVQYSVNGGPWQQAAGTDNFSAVLDLSSAPDMSEHNIKIRVIDRAGLVFTDPYGTNVTVSTAKPVVTAFYPEDGSTGHPGTVDIKVYFNKAVDEVSVKKGFLVYGPGAVPVKGSIRVTDDGEEYFAQFMPLTPLGGGEYQVEVTTEVTDLVGNTLAEAVSWSFSTKGLIAVISSPVNGGFIGGITPVMGSAYSANIKEYSLETAPAADPDNWTEIVNVQGKNVFGESFLHQEEADFQGGSLVNLRIAEDGLRPIETTVYKNDKRHFHYERFTHPANRGNVLAGKPFTYSHAPNTFSPALNTTYRWDNDTFLTNEREANTYYVQYDMDAFGVALGNELQLEYVVDAQREVILSRLQLIFVTTYQHQPENVLFYTSEDGEEWVPVGTDSKTGPTQNKSVFQADFADRKARYVKFVVTKGYHSSTYRYMRLSRLSSIGYNAAGVVTYAHAALHDNGYVEVMANAPEKKFFTVARVGTDEYILDFRDADISRMRLFFSRVALASTNNSIQVFRWVDGAFEVSPSWTYNSTTIQSNYWSPYFTSNRLRIIVNVATTNTTTSNGVWLDNVELENLERPYIISQFSLPETGKLRAYQNIGDSAGQGFSHQYRSSLDGLNWSGWSGQVNTLPDGKYVQVRTEFFGPAVYTAQPKVLEQELTYASPQGEYTSPVIDAGMEVTWAALSWLGWQDSTMRLRVGDTPSPDASWTAWSEALAAPSDLSGYYGRYLQYKLETRNNLPLYGEVRFDTSPEPLGLWDTATLPDGLHLLRLRVANLVDEEETFQVSVYVDHTPPVITITNPLEGGLVGQGTVVTGTVSDELSGIGGVEINLNDEGWLPLAIVDGNFSHAWDPSYLPDDTETTIRVRATDNTGNTSEATVNVIVSVTTPVTTIVVNATPNGNNWYNVHPQVTLTVNKPASIYYQWTDIGQATAPGSGYTLYTAPFTQVDGQYKLWYYSEDALGNKETTQVEEFRIDTVPPVVTFHDPTLVNEFYTRQTSFVVEHAPDNPWYCQYSLNGGAWTNITSYNATTRRYTQTLTLVNGWHTLRFRIYDLAGNMTQTEVVSFFMDRDLPTASLTATIPWNSWVKSGTVFGMNLIVRDHTNPNQSGLHQWQVSFTGNPDIVGTQEYTAATYIGDFTIPALATPYTTGWSGFVTVTAWDKAMGSTTVSAGRFNIDDIPPRVLITSHDTTRPLYFNAETLVPQISLSGTVTDVGSGVERVEIRYGGEGWVLADRAGGTWSKTIPLKQDDGNYSIQVRAFDVAGNESRYSRTLNVVIDTTPPTINTVIAKEDKSLGGINLTWKPSQDNLSGINYYLVYRNANPTPVQIFYLDGLVAGPGPFHANVGVDKYMAYNTPHNYRVQAVDKAGNKSPLSNIATAIYDTHAPTAPGSLRAEVAGYANTINLSWNPSSDNITIGGYIIERSTNGVTFTEINRTQLGTNVIPRYADRNLAYGQTYWYRVRAFDMSNPNPNVSAPSSVVAANTALYLPAFLIPHGDYHLPDRNDLCMVCHNTHTAKGNNLLAEDMESIVCYNCHDGHGSIYAIKSEIDYSPTHHRVVTPLEPNNLMRCSSCHNPHLSDNEVPKLLRSFDRFGNMRSGGPEFCLSCHGNEAFAPNPGGSQGRFLLSTHISRNTPYIEPYGRTGVDCLYCHDNHGSPYFRQTIRNEEEICFDCHDERYNEWVQIKGQWPVWSQFNPDFTVNPRASRHGIEMAGAVVKCTSCHGQRFITSDSFDSAASALGIGSNLSDPFNIRNLFTQQDGDFNDFCLACHRDDPPQAISTSDTIIPYSIYYPANAITTSANGWDRTSYKTPGVSHYDQGFTCRTCHHSHGSGYLRLVLLREDSPTQKGMCFSCHDQNRQHGAANVWGDFQKANKHPLTAGVHTDGKNYRTIPVGQRHTSCMDCHDPHTATKRQSVQGSPEGAGTQDNVSGVKVIANGAAGTVPTYAFMSAVTLEYELCFKCHSSYTTMPAGKPDLALLTNPNNPSYHPIQARAKKNYIRQEAFVPGWGLDSFVKCTDCHGSETGSNGIHGSANAKLLKKRNDVNPAIQVDGVWVPNPALLCFNCHDGYTYYGRGGANGLTKASRYKHTYQHGGSYSCNYCHTTHGSTTMPNLIDTAWFYYEDVSPTQGRIRFKQGCGCHSVGYSITYTKLY